MKKKIVIGSIAALIVLSALAAQVLTTDARFGGSTRFISPSQYQVTMTPLDGAVMAIDFVNKPAGVFTNYSNPIYLTRTGIVASITGSSFGSVTDYTGDIWTNVGPLWQDSNGLTPPQFLVNNSLESAPFKINVTDNVITTNTLTLRGLFMDWTSDIQNSGRITAGTGFYGDGSHLTNMTSSSGVYSNQTLTIAGTANQVISSVGAQDLSVNRTVTLSTPQDIGTASAVQHGRLGLGVAPDATVPLNIWETIATSTSTDGISLSNTTVATVGAQAQSPWIELDGNGWKTTATAGSQPVGIRFGAMPIQAATSPSVFYRLQTMTNNAAFKTVMDISADGGQTNTGQFLSIGGGFLFTGPNGGSFSSIAAGVNQLILSGATTTSLGLGGVAAVQLVSGEFGPTSSDGGYDCADSGNRWRSFWIINQVRKTIDATSTSASLATTGLSAPTLSNSRIYGIHAVLYFNNSTAADGLAIDFSGGTVTATGFRCGVVISDTTGVVKTAQFTALNTAITVATITGDTMAVCDGMIECSGSGSFIPRFAVNSHSTGTLTCYKYSYIVPSNFP